jgi:hypothetical protein
MSVRDLIAAVRDAMDELETSRSGGIGAEGPGLDDLDAYARATGGASWGDDAGYHTAQRAWRLLEDGLDKYERNAAGQARAVASRPAPACSALCKQCAAEQGRSVEWDAFHYGTNRRCDACDREGLCAMMPNSAICRNEGVQYTMHPKMARKLADYRRRQTRRATA